ncbi:MAG: glycosyltransferase family 4 protein [Bacteroidota bacterium]
MKKILWQSRTPVVYEAVQSGHLPSGANGGNAYDFFAAMSLKEQFDLQMDVAAVLKKKDSFRSYWWRMSHHQPQADVVVCEPSPIVFGKRNKHARTIAMIHHIDDELANSSFRHKWFFDRLKKRLAEVDVVVTVSKYWEEYLANLGCKRIKIIYNSFDPVEYQTGSDEAEAFKKQYSFDTSLPIVYIGNAHKQKGVYEAYEALKDKKVQLVMTGLKNHTPDLPVKFLSLNRTDYLALLRCSDVVITLSRMTEGWNRIAHEALLCRTPVIGSGTGGMKELLENAGQLIVKDSNYLAEAVEKVLLHREQFSDSGFTYVKKFDMQYFKTEWVNTVRSLTEG